MSVLPPPDGDRQDPLKIDRDHVDITGVSMPTVSTRPAGAPSTHDLTAAMHELLDHVVGHVPGVVGAVVSTADGFSLAARLPTDTPADSASVAAMSAALVGLSNRLLDTIAPEPARALELRSESAHGYVFAVGQAATLTLLALPESERPQVMAVGREVTAGLLRLLRAPGDA